MSEEDLSIEEKQNYLRENILEKNYDTNSFIEFLKEKKEDGDDIQNWSFPDLKQVVKEFISLQDNNNTNNNNDDQINNNIENENENEAKIENVEKTEEKVEKTEEKLEKTEEKEVKTKEKEEKTEEKEEKQEKQGKEQKKGKEKNEGNDWVTIDANDSKKNEQKKDGNQTEQENKDIGGYGISFLKEIKCHNIPNNQLSKVDNIQIKIGSFQKVEGKLFVKSYITYLVTTMPLNLKVWRRFSDFEWLHQILLNHYSYCLIPFAPRKKKNLNKIVADRFDDAFLKKRSRKFERFLNYLINDPILKHLKVVYDFLSIEKDDDFQKLKKSYDKMKISTNIKDFITLDGNANIEINDKNEKYLIKIKDNTNNNENILRKINTSIKLLKEDLLNASQRLKEISQNWNLLKKNAISFGEKEGVHRCYEELNSMFENLSLYISRQNYMIYVYLREYFMFVSKNFHSMKGFIHATENLKNSFYKSLKNLKTKKEDLFRKPETFGKWEIDPKDKTDKKTLTSNRTIALEKMLYKDTANVNNQKQMYGFYLNRVISEFERMIKVNSEEHLKGLIKLFEKLTNYTTDFMTGLADNSTSLIMVKKGEKNLVKKKERKVQKGEFDEDLDLAIKNSGATNGKQNDENKGEKK